MNAKVKVEKILKEGPSGAKVELLTNGVVRKSIKGNVFKLADQYQWLVDNQKFNFFPKVENPINSYRSFSYDMPFYSNHEMLHFLVKPYGEKWVTEVLNKIISSLNENLYSHSKGKTSENLWKSYLEEKVLKKIKLCQSLDKKANEIISYESLIINDVEYENFFSFWNNQIKDLSIVKGFEIKDSCPIHGDLTCENILVDKDKNFILIDPNMENFISTPAVDFGKLYQSIHSSYEYMQKSINFESNGNSFVIDDKSLIKNDGILESLGEIFENQFAVTHREVVLHEAIHFARMLPYQLQASPEKFPIYYLRMIELFHESIKE